MNVTGTVTLAAPVGRVWNALYDTNVLARTIPGCTQIASAGAGCYHVAVSTRAVSVSGAYLGQFRLTEPRPRSSFVLRAVGQGTPGTVDATVRVQLSESGDGGTRVDYDADAVVSGMLDSVGQRMLARVATKAAQQFLTALDRELMATPELSAPPVAAATRPDGGVLTPTPVETPERGRWRVSRRVRYEVAIAALLGGGLLAISIVLARRIRTPRIVR